MTLGDQIRRSVRHAVDAARSRARAGAGRTRLEHPVNVVVARNVGGHGTVEHSSSRQTVVIDDGRGASTTEVGTDVAGTTRREGERRGTK